MKRNNKHFKINPKDITWETSPLWKENEVFDITINPDVKHSKKANVGASRAGGHAPRSSSHTDYRLRVSHVPSGVTVDGRYHGYYNRKDQKKLTSELWAQLVEALQKKVAKHLRVSGK